MLPKMAEPPSQCHSECLTNRIVDILSKRISLCLATKLCDLLDWTAFDDDKQLMFQGRLYLARPKEELRSIELVSPLLATNPFI